MSATFRAGFRQRPILNLLIPKQNGKKEIANASRMEKKEIAKSRIDFFKKKPDFTHFDRAKFLFNTPTNV